MKVSNRVTDRLVRMLSKLGLAQPAGSPAAGHLQLSIGHSRTKSDGMIHSSRTAETASAEVGHDNER
jgi:hypothetical protein